MAHTCQIFSPVYTFQGLSLEPSSVELEAPGAFPETPPQKQAPERVYHVEE